MPEPILVPLLNPNEPDALLAALHVAEGQPVKQGDLLCTLETTKSAADVEAPADGYVVALAAAQGDTLRAGDVLCYLAGSPDWRPAGHSDAPRTQAARPPGLRITGPALALAAQHGLDLAALPAGPLITESMLRALLDETQSPAVPLSAPVEPYDPAAILVYGGSGHGKACIDLLRSLGSYEIRGLIDDGMAKGEEVMGIPVMGGADALPELHAAQIRQAVNAVGGVGDIGSRVGVFNKLAQAGFFCPTLVHPTAFVEKSAQLSPGVQVFPQAYVGSEARLGFGVIVNTSAVVSHDCVLEDYVNISPGALLAGGVTVGEKSLIGMGVTINLGVKVSANARIGNSSTVKSDVPPGGIVPAGTVWPLK